MRSPGNLCSWKHAIKAKGAAPPYIIPLSHLLSLSPHLSKFHTKTPRRKHSLRQGGRALMSSKRVQESFAPFRALMETSVILSIGRCPILMAVSPLDSKMAEIYFNNCSLSCCRCCEFTPARKPIPLNPPSPRGTSVDEPFRLKTAEIYLSNCLVSCCRFCEFTNLRIHEFTPPWNQSPWIPLSPRGTSADGADLQIHKFTNSHFIVFPFIHLWKKTAVSDFKYFNIFLIKPCFSHFETICPILRQFSDFWFL